MGSFEWMELQTLTAEISTSRTRLSTARANKDHRLARMLEEEITAAEKRRSRLLARITNHLASVPEGAAPEEAAAVAGLGAASADVREDSEEFRDVEEKPDDVEDVKEKLSEVEGKQPPLEPADRMTGTDALLMASAPKSDRVRGAISVWDQLTPNDIERARQELGVRRAEVLARQAEELKVLDGDQSLLEALEQAVDAFMRKFTPAASEASVVVLGEERETRMQSRA